MRGINKAFAIVACLILLLLTHSTAFCVVEIDVSGVGAIENGNMAKAEQSALQDAFAKALLQIGLRYVPSGSSYELVRQLQDYIAKRGMQDILQYQITLRTQQYNTLQLNVTLKMDESLYKDWLYNQSLTTPLILRPKILIMISSLGPGNTEKHEWWTIKGKRSFSAFEQKLFEDLKLRGENVMEVPQITKEIQSKDIKSVDIAKVIGADLLITGSITYTPVADTLYECTIEVTMYDIQTSASLSTWSSSHRGDFELKDMHSFLSNALIENIKARIAHKMLSTSPLSVKKRLCIEGIKDYLTYQTIINKLNAMESITRIEINSILNHTICHTISIKGNLSDIMENLKAEQIADVDMEVEGDTVNIHIFEK